MTIDPKRVKGQSRRPLLFKDIQYAQSQTKSHAEAARYLHVSFGTYKRWATAYELYENEQKNAAGKGVSKQRTKGLFGLDEILAGKHPNYDRYKLKERLIRSGYLTASCELCGHTKTRPDGRGPFVLQYRNGNTLDLAINNLYVLCYNCTYLTTGRVALNADGSVFSEGSYSQDQIDVLGDDEMEALRQELQDSQPSELNE
jgi:hypothetical protein